MKIDLPTDISIALRRPATELALLGMWLLKLPQAPSRGNPDATTTDDDQKKSPPVRAGLGGGDELD